MTVFAGRRGDQCIIFRDQGSTDPPGGLSSMYLVYATPATVLLDSCETLLVFRAWSEDMHIVWISCSDYFCHFFHKTNSVIFPAEVNRCVCNSSYSLL